MVTLFAWMAHRLVSSNNPTKYASLASYNEKKFSECSWNERYNARRQKGSVIPAMLQLLHSGNADLSWNPVQFLWQVAGKAASWWATRWTSGTDGSHAEQQYRVYKERQHPHHQPSFNWHHCSLRPQSVPVSVRFLHTSGRWRALPGSFGCQLLPRSLSSRGFTSCLLGTSHTFLLETRGKLITFPENTHRWSFTPSIKSHMVNANKTLRLEWLVSLLRSQRKTMSWFIFTSFPLLVFTQARPSPDTCDQPKAPQSPGAATAPYDDRAARGRHH